MTRRHRIRFTFNLNLILALCLTAGCGTSGTVQHDPRIDADQLARIPQRMKQFVQEKQISGAVTLVGLDGRIVEWDAVGLTANVTRQPMTNDTLFWIASMTKPITAAALLICQDDGKVSVDDPVSKYIPAFKDVKLKDGTSPKTTLTIRHLLTHTSGVTNPGGLEDLSLKDAAEQMAQQPLQFEPGSQWKYSNGLHVVARVIEITSGMSYEDFLAQRIFKPLGMTNTTFWPSDAQRKNLAVIYKPAKNDAGMEPANAWFASFDPAHRRPPNPSGGLVSSAHDLFRFYQMLLNGGELDGKRIVSAAAVKQMTSLQTGDLVTGFTPGNGWGLGCCIVRQPQGVTAMLHRGTFGHGGAFGTQGWIDPQSKMIFVLLIQRTNFGNADASDIRDAFQDLAVKALTAP